MACGQCLADSGKQPGPPASICDPAGGPPRSRAPCRISLIRSLGCNSTEVSFFTCSVCLPPVLLQLPGELPCNLTACSSPSQSVSREPGLSPGWSRLVYRGERNEGQRVKSRENNWESLREILNGGEVKSTPKQNGH